MLITKEQEKVVDSLSKNVNDVQLVKTKTAGGASIERFMLCIQIRVQKSKIWL